MSRTALTLSRPPKPTQFEPTPSAHAVNSIDWIARLASEMANRLLSVATTIASGACATYGPLERLAFEAAVDLGGHVEGAIDQTPAGHPLPRPARLVLGDGGGLLQLDPAQVEVVGAQRVHVGMPGPVAHEVRDVPPLVGVDA